MLHAAAGQQATSFPAIQRHTGSWLTARTGRQSRRSSAAGSAGRGGGRRRQLRRGARQAPLRPPQGWWLQAGFGRQGGRTGVESGTLRAAVEVCKFAPQQPDISSSLAAACARCVWNEFPKVKSRPSSPSSSPSPLPSAACLHAWMSARRLPIPPHLHRHTHLNRYCDAPCELRTWALASMHSMGTEAHQAGSQTQTASREFTHRLMASSTAAFASRPSGSTRHRFMMPRYSPARAERLQCVEEATDSRL